MKKINKIEGWKDVFVCNFSIFPFFEAQFDQESYQKRELVPLKSNHEN